MIAFAGVVNYISATRPVDENRPTCSLSTSDGLVWRRFGTVRFGLHVKTGAFVGGRARCFRCLASVVASTSAVEIFCEHL